MTSFFGAQPFILKGFGDFATEGKLLQHGVFFLQEVQIPLGLKVDGLDLEGFFPEFLGGGEIALAVAFQVQVKGRIAGKSGLRFQNGKWWPGP